MVLGASVRLPPVPHLVDPVVGSLVVLRGGLLRRCNPLLLDLHPLRGRGVVDLVAAVVPGGVRLGALPPRRSLVLPAGLVGLGPRAVVPGDPRVRLVVGTPALVVAAVDVVRRRRGPPGGGRGGVRGGGR